MQKEIFCSRLSGSSLYRIRRLISVFLLVLLSAVSFSGCTSVPAADDSGRPQFSANSPDNVLISREVLHPAITFEKYRNKAYPVIWHLVTIQLSDSRISLVADPLSCKEYGIVEGETASAFAKRTGAFLVINMSPFSTPGKVPYNKTKNRVLSGIFIADGIQYSNPVSYHAAIGFTREKKAFILDNQKKTLPENTVFLFDAFNQILKNGEHYGDYKDIQDSRNIAGISEDGMTLYLLSVEGEIDFMSVGLNYYDCAEILKKAGAADAVALDGGYSTSLVIQGKNRLSYPSLRAVCNHLGVMISTSVY